MPETFQPYQAKNVDLLLGDDAPGAATNFRCQARSVVLTPDQNVSRTRTLCPDGQFSIVSEPEWTLTISYLYGFDSGDPEAALAEYLRAHAGEIVPYIYRPVAGQDATGYQGRCTLIAGPIGGGEAGGDFAEHSVDLPVEGQPVPIGAGGGGGDLTPTVTPAPADPMTAQVQTPGATEPVTATYGDETAPAAAAAGGA